MQNRFRALLLIGGDIFTLIISFMLMLNLAFRDELTNAIFNLHVLPFLILSIFWLIIFFIFNLYDTEKSKPTIPHLQQIITAFIVAILFAIVFFYIVPFQIEPKTNLLSFGLSSFILFICWRRIFYNIFSSYFYKDVIFIKNGNNENRYTENLITYIKTYPQSGLRIVGVYNSVEDFFKENIKNPQIFIITKEIWSVDKNFQKLNNTGSEILDLAYVYEDILSRVPIDIIDEGWFMYNMQSNHQKFYERCEKILNVIIIIPTIIIISPILFISMLLIKIYDGGPIFYSQTRVGKNGKKFNLYKFRSMIVNAEKNGAEWSKEGDDRVTPIGKILRRTHIDEIPQMLNVLKGDIALVGPRPERPEFVEALEKEIPFYYLRHTINPGFTGWAQIKFRYARTVMDSKDKFEYDLYYLKNKNIIMDLGILIRTIQIIFTH